MGTIKFISGNPEFLHEMIGKGAVEILMNLIKQVNENTKKSGTCLPNSGHLLVQVSILLERFRLVKLIFMLSNITYMPGGCNRWPVTRSQVGVLGLRDQGSGQPHLRPVCACFLWKGYSVAFYMQLSPACATIAATLQRAGLKDEYLAPLQLHVIIRTFTGRVWTFRVSFYNFIYLFVIFDCFRSWLLRGLFSRCGVWGLLFIAEVSHVAEHVL